MRIVPLVERPDLAEQVSVWGFDEWGHLNPGQTLDQRRAEIQGKMNIDRVPIAFVALGDDDGIVGTASLIFDDLEGDPRNPWLASVYVPPNIARRASPRRWSAPSRMPRGASATTVSISSPPPPRPLRRSRLEAA